MTSNLSKSFVRWLLIAATVCTSMVHCVAAAETKGPLVTAEWLQKNLAREDILVIDTSGTKSYAAKHVPGAVNVDIYAVGMFLGLPAAAMEQRFQAWGVDAARKIVIYDEGASWTATWFFSELAYYGFPTENLAILDGGMARWEGAGGAVTKDPPTVRKGAFRVTTLRNEERSKLPEFLNASGDRVNHVVVDALETPYYYGGAKFFDRGGHVPNAISLPISEFYNADKTFKSPEEIRKMLAFHGIKPNQVVHSYCGGGGAATTPYFALKFLAGHSNVRVYKESQREWLSDERGLPVWTYAAPNMSRDAGWVQTWGTSRMFRAFGINQVSLVDVRPAEAFRQNHVPFAVNVPAELIKANLDNPAKLAEALAAAGVNPAHEAVIVSGGGVNESSALAFVALEKLGQKKVSLLKESVDDWGIKGFTLTKVDTIVGPPTDPKGFFVPPTTYPVSPRADVVIKDARSTAGAYPKVFLSSGRKPSTKTQDGKVVHVPSSDLVNPDGTPKAASDIHNVLAKAGVPKYAEIIVFADDPAEAAVNYYVLKLMGYPDVKVLI